MTISAVWPLYDLRIRTPLLELRLPTPDDLAALAALGAEGIYDPADPHVFPVSGWTNRASVACSRWTKNAEIPTSKSAAPAADRKTNLRKARRVMNEGFSRRRNEGLTGLSAQEL